MKIFSIITLILSLLVLNPRVAYAFLKLSPEKYAFTIGSLKSEIYTLHNNEHCRSFNKISNLCIARGSSIYFCSIFSIDYYMLFFDDMESCKETLKLVRLVAIDR